ncbi:glucose-6-phosphate 1-epimerase [Mesocricetibacter intestinalis]|uniref:Putative glucose-6-phosphate 1-epimerase n=1 Tax=Mesocricetibacter intestinalis TaxID=1521930 RepID=A0A4R6VB23_9PAST|nr:D-hexose-6-phosphate mutarotase [Mesocricetibacter intestinalis]TDQ57331.1 glucose-6-phosphate 1-epimerase [Mesocricetibacter intestinalis]
MEYKLVEQITPALSLYHYNEIPVLKLQHEIGSAEIALQGAHLLSWKPRHTQQDVFWLSEIEPFSLGKAIRGGIPICYPWFNNAGTPAHGFARISLWKLSEYIIESDKVRLVFSLFSAQDIILAQIIMTFDRECEITFVNFAESQAQLALHSYFNLGDIEQTILHNLSEQCFDSLSQSEQIVPSPRSIGEHVDCIYPRPNQPTLIEDPLYKRIIKIEHSNASDIVVWNPWHKATSAMSEQAYRNMLCVETARIRQRLERGERVAVKISVE